MLLKDCATTPDLIAELARSHAEAPALADSEEGLSFAQLHARAQASAAGLLEEGFGPGDRIGILMGNSTLWLISAMAIQSIGATAVAMNTWFKLRELKYVIQHARLNGILAAAFYNGVDYAAMLAPLPGDAFPELRKILFPARTVALEISNAKRDELKSIAAKIDPRSPAYLLYTSGSTARPKGVRIGHRALINASANAAERFGFTADDRVFLPISLFWAAGCLNATMAAWTSAASIVLQEKFDVEQSFAIIDRNRCTAMFAAEKMITSMMSHPQFHSADRSFLRKGMISGSPAMVRRTIETLLPDACQAFGLTETHGFVVAGDVRDDKENRIASHGKPLAGVALRIVDPASGDRLEAGEKGEIRVKGPFAVEYFEDPEATALAHDTDGYFKTGDIGFVDADGALHFEGRLKDMLKIDGMNVSPSEVEDVLQEHPMVAEAYVTSVRLAGKEEIAVVVVPGAGAELTEAELRRFCGSELAAYKRPRHFLTKASDEIPLTGSGKIHRAALAELFDAAFADAQS